VPALLAYCKAIWRATLRRGRPRSPAGCHCRGNGASVPSKYFVSWCLGVKRVADSSTGGHSTSGNPLRARPRRSVALQVQQWYRVEKFCARLLGACVWFIIRSVGCALALEQGAAAALPWGFRGNIELANAIALGCNFPTTGCSAVVAITPNCCGIVVTDGCRN